MRIFKRINYSLKCDDDPTNCNLFSEGKHWELETKPYFNYKYINWYTYFII